MKFVIYLVSSRIISGLTYCLWLIIVARSPWEWFKSRSPCRGSFARWHHALPYFTQRVRRDFSSLPLDLLDDGLPEASDERERSLIMNLPRSTAADEGPLRGLIKAVTSRGTKADFHRSDTQIISHCLTWCQSSFLKVAVRAPGRWGEPSSFIRWVFNDTRFIFWCYYSCYFALIREALARFLSVPCRVNSASESLFLQPEKQVHQRICSKWDKNIAGVWKSRAKIKRLGQKERSVCIW